MKRLTYILLATLLITLPCCQKHGKENTDTSIFIHLSETDSVDGNGMLQLLNTNGLSLLVYNNGMITHHDNRGIQDLLTLLNEQPERLKGAVVADKITGKASAALLAAGGAIALFTNVICTPAKELLQANGIEVYFSEEVPMIINRTGDGQCPMDARLQNINSVEEAAQILSTEIYTNL